MTTEFVIDAHPSGCNLRIVQELAPHEPLLDDYFDACVLGWQNCFAGYSQVSSPEPGLTDLYGTI